MKTKRIFKALAIAIILAIVMMPVAKAESEKYTITRYNPGEIMDSDGNLISTETFCLDQEMKTPYKNSYTRIKLSELGSYYKVYENSYNGDYTYYYSRNELDKQRLLKLLMTSNSTLKAKANEIDTSGIRDYIYSQSAYVESFMGRNLPEFLQNARDNGYNTNNLTDYNGQISFLLNIRDTNESAFHVIYNDAFQDIFTGKIFQPHLNSN